MELQNFNVFGMIFMTEDKTKITATVFDGKRPISLSHTFREANEKLSGLVLPFAARLSTKEETPLLLGERAIKIDTAQVANTALYANKLDRIQEHLSEILATLEMETSNVDATQPGASGELESPTLRQPSKTGELIALSQAIMIYTKEGNVVVDLDLAREIAGNLPAYIKKASKGIVDKETKSWILRTFSRK